MNYTTTRVQTPKKKANLSISGKPMLKSYTDSGTAEMYERTPAVLFNGNASMGYHVLMQCNMAQEENPNYADISYYTVDGDKFVLTAKFENGAWWMSENNDHTYGNGTMREFFKAVYGKLSEIGY